MRYPMVFLVGVFVFWTWVLVTHTQQETWVFKMCFTNDCIKDTLNSLTPERAHEAKLTTWQSATYVWYRK